MKKGKLFLLLVLAVFASCSKDDIPLYRIQENGLYGFIDSLGNVVIDPQYKYVGDFNEDGYATVITQYQYAFKQRETRNFFTDTTIIKIDTSVVIKYGFINKSNQFVVDTMHALELDDLNCKWLGYENIPNFVEVFNGNKLGFRSEYDPGIKLQSNLFVVQDTSTKLMGYMNLKGDTIIPTKYYHCRPFYNGVAVVSKEPDFSGENFDAFNRMFLIDSLGNELNNAAYFSIRDFVYDKSWALKILFKDDGAEATWFLLDKNASVCADSFPVIGSSMIIHNNSQDWYKWQCNLTLGDVHLGTFYSFINKDGKFLTDTDHSGTITFWEETFMDVTNMVDSIVGIRFMYDEETPAWVFTNYQFEIESQPFDSVYQFKEDLAAVKEFSKDKTSKWGFVNKEYEVVIPYKYDEVGSFNKGLAYFRISNIEGYINKNGDVVWSTERN